MSKVIRQLIHQPDTNLPSTWPSGKFPFECQKLDIFFKKKTKIDIFFPKKIDIGNFVEKMTIFVNFFLKCQVLAIFWQSNGNFPEGQPSTYVLSKQSSQCAQIWAQSGSDWPQMGQNRDFFRSDFSRPTIGLAKSSTSK